MKDLSERDVHRALAVVAAAAADGNGIAFGIETVDAILAAIPADEAAYVEWRFGDRESRAVKTNRRGSTRRSRRPAARIHSATSITPLRLSR